MDVIIVHDNTTWQISGESSSEPIKKFSLTARRKPKGKHMATSIQDMIARAAEEVGTTPGTPTGSSDSVEESTSGIQIERQNIEHVQGQAKSGECDNDSCEA